jgi:hypothetical protein
MSKSVRHTPHAVTRSSISWADGVGIGKDFARKGVYGMSSTMECMVEGFTLPSFSALVFMAGIFDTFRLRTMPFTK